jgi:hypothetical protein
VTTVTKSWLDRPPVDPGQASSFEETRRLETLARLRHATFVLMLPFTLALAIRSLQAGWRTPA